MTIQPYTEDLAASIAAFNRRVASAEVPFQIPELPDPLLRQPVHRGNLWHELYLALEKGQVRGGYKIKHQDFSFRGRVRSIGFYQNPISEGIVDNRYVLVGLRLIDDALQRQPLLYDLGIGSLNAAVARMHRAMGWRMEVIPFFFKVRNGFQFLRNMQYLKTTPVRRFLLDAAAYSGLGWAGAEVANALTTTRNGSLKQTSVEEAGGFSTWADEVWEKCRTEYSMTAVRDADALNTLYPSSDARFIRLKVLRGSNVLGWAVMLDTQMSDHKYFGNMRVGSVVDCLAAPSDALTVIAAATGVLERRGVDLMVSNQSHPGWQRAFQGAGFLSAPSNYILAASIKLTALLDEMDPSWTGIHLTRGDGDGPIHL